MKPPLVVGNWKMHGTRAEARDLARRVREGTGGLDRVEVALSPPFTALATVGDVLRGTRLQLAAQNVHWEEKGAFTGEISPLMLRDLGCDFVLTGHSERRHLFHESDRTVARKVLASLRCDLRPLLCVGETLREREEGKTSRVISRQLRTALKGVAKDAIDRITVAYEPVWAIGTGRNASPDQITHVHQWIRKVLKDLFGKDKAMTSRILYGGSVRPENSNDLAAAAEVNGLLVGGASLQPESFLKIIRAFA